MLVCVMRCGLGAAISLSKAGIDVGIDLGDAPRRMDRDDRRLMIFQLGQGSHFEEVDCVLLFTGGE
jgi:hypothetical protein